MWRGRLLGGVLLVVVRVLVARRERDPGAVGRPDRVLDIARVIRQPAGLTAVGRYQIEVRGRFFLPPLGHERERPPVRRPARGVVAVPAGEGARRRGAVGRHQPDRAPGAVRGLVDVPAHERDEAAVGRDARVGGAAQQQHVAGPQRGEGVRATGRRARHRLLGVRRGRVAAHSGDPSAPRGAHLPTGANDATVTSPPARGRAPVGVRRSRFPVDESGDRRSPSTRPPPPRTA